MLAYSEFIELRDKLVNGEIGLEVAKARYWKNFEEGIFTLFRRQCQISFL